VLWATRLIARHLFGLQKRRELKADLEAVLQKAGWEKPDQQRAGGATDPGRAPAAPAGNP
ncbi:MAG TPA: hypothetical protein VK852_14545, partial [Desulfobacterales bacterium]|nr:hypothetical protein [Desulfobacterales bacterium]